MIKIGLLSDTHSYLDPKVFNYFESCDEIWHAGDIGSIQIVDQLKEFKKTQIVFGNIDDHKIRTITKEHELFQAEDFKVLLIHIAGKFGSYNPKAVSYTHLRAHETVLDLVCRLLLEKKKTILQKKKQKLTYNI